MSLRSIVVGLMLSATTASTYAVEVVFYDFDNVVLNGVPQTSIINVPRRIDGRVDGGPAIGLVWSAGIGGTLNQTGVGAPGGGVATNLRAVGAGPTVPIGNNLFQWDSNQSLGFKFTIDPSVSLNLANVSFAERFGGGEGLVRTFEQWQIKINGMPVAQGDAILSAPEIFSNHDVSLAHVTGLTGVVTFQFFGLGNLGVVAAGPDTGQGGNWRIDNFALNGSFVPLPGAVWLLGSALGGLIAFRRRAA